MRIIHVNVIEWGRGAWLTAAMAIAVTLAQPFDLATAQAEDPAEVQRRQQIKQQATHWEQQLTKLLYGDLELIRSRSDDIPRDARKAIARDGEQAVKEAAVRLAELQFGGRKGEQNTSGDPADLVSTALAKSLAQADRRAERTSQGRGCSRHRGRAGRRALSDGRATGADRTVAFGEVERLHDGVVGGDALRR